MTCSKLSMNVSYYFYNEVHDMHIKLYKSPRAVLFCEIYVNNTRIKLYLGIYPSKCDILIYTLKLSITKIVNPPYYVYTLWVI